MKTKESTRKLYARPQMTVVELRHQCCILAGSGWRTGVAGHSPPM